MCSEGSPFFGLGNGVHFTHLPKPPPWLRRAAYLTPRCANFVKVSDEVELLVSGRRKEADGDIRSHADPNSIVNDVVRIKPRMGVVRTGRSEFEALLAVVERE